MNSNGIQDFLFRHVEKFIFGTLVLTAVLLIYSGIQKPDYLSKQKPDQMEKGASEVRTAIDVDHWESLAEPRLVSIDVVARTNESIRPVPAGEYRLSHPWEAKSIDLSVKREDPAVPAPIELLATGVIAALAYKSNDPEYPLKELENAEPIERAPEPRRTPPPRRRRQMMMGSEEMMMEMDASMMTEEMSMMESDPMMMGAPGMTAARRIDAKLYDQGFRPQGNAADLVPVMGHFIAGVALMPHRELFTSFEKALQQADGYNPRRDQPRYIMFQLQRADVTDRAVDQLTDDDWIQRGYSRTFQRQVLPYWAGMAKEIVTGKYRDPELTTPIPPVLLTHYTHFAAHPKIPLGDEDPRASQSQPGRGQSIPTGPLQFDAEQDPLANQATQQGRRGTARSRAGMMPGGFSGPSMMPGMTGAGMFGATMLASDQAEHKLIRFYDFRDLSGRDPSAPQPGRRYVYRLRVAIEDPNFPEDELAQPRSSTLSAEVYQRVRQQMDDAASKNRRNYLRWSQWSAPSPIVSLPPTTQVYAGPVTPPTIRKMQAGGREIEYVQKPPTGKLVVAKWDKTYQVPVPVFMDVMRGSLVAKTGEFEVPDPLSLVVKKLPETSIDTQTVVLDMGGGQPLAISPAENQTEPSLMLLFDSDGGLRVADEVGSQQRYRMYSFADDRGE